MGALVLEMLAETPDRAASPAELAARLRQEVEDVPADAEQIITSFLAELDAGGILETIEEDAA